MSQKKINIKDKDRHHLSINDAIKLIKESKLENSASGLSQQALANKYNVSIGYVNKILKNKQEYVNKYEANCSSSRCHVLRKTKNEIINAATLKFFKECRARKLPINGPLIQEYALEIAQKHNIDKFTASDGWLDKWKKRYNV